MNEHHEFGAGQNHREPQHGSLIPPSGVSIVIPVYRGQHSLRELHQRLTAALAKGGRDWELILVDDASPDQSWSIIRELCDGDTRVMGMQMSRNYGQHAALLAGIRAATHPVTVTMDDDLQHRPEEVLDLVRALDSGEVDLVYGKSVVEEHGFWRNATSRLAKWTISATIGADQARDSSAFRAFRTQLREGWNQVSDPYVSIDVLLSWTTTRHSAVPVTMDQRTTGQSNYTVRKLVRHMLNMFTGYSTRPLRIVTWLGFITSLFGLCIMVYVVIQRIVVGDVVPGFAFLASLIAVLGGLQLFGLGVIGEYLGRVHVRSMAQPTFVLRQVYGRTQSK